MGLVNTNTTMVKFVTRCTTLCCILFTTMHQLWFMEAYSPAVKENTSRRQMIRNIASSAAAVTTPLLIRQQSSQAMYENAPVVETERISLPSGVSIQDLREGDGEEVREGNRVYIQWVLKRSNGYFIDSSSNHDGVPIIFIVGGYDDTKNKESGGLQQQHTISGLDEGIWGMRVGGICRIVIPPSLAYVEGLNEHTNPGLIPLGFGPKQRIRRLMENCIDITDESFIIDVKATRVQ